MSPIFRRKKFIDESIFLTLLWMTSVFILSRSKEEEQDEYQSALIFSNRHIPKPWLATIFFLLPFKSTFRILVTQCRQQHNNFLECYCLWHPQVKYRRFGPGSRGSRGRHSLNPETGINLAKNIRMTEVSNRRFPPFRWANRKIDATLFETFFRLH